jgi:flagellar L-ring protein precursor FlgH
MQDSLKTWLCGTLLMLAGCANNVPSTNIHQPMTARAAVQPEPVAHNGAIYQAGKNERPLFEDRRARNVGDVLTINITEVTSASEKSSANAAHSGSTSPNTTTGSGRSLLLNPLGISGSSSASLANKSDSAGNNTFSGTITATVIEVLPNGNLLVSGEKQIAINQSNEFVRFSGVVNPATISGSNTVQSTQVADVHVEYKGAANIDKSALMSMFSRLFLSVLPF